ncbi:glycosyl hydrolase 115 family protein [Halorubrum lipolyticum]|uniref:Gylcosyl hydrolase 115 C-terminal domain-containing protein n=1 Tax=Halorubrum lipolyticum DSM 21995 TaxID=1227482 RepID=M0NP33_9EURY|nr:glycosyl hydrolase 115 family protein [Halorubrum lipolyticum]EMA59717.1 hypothetical protein C469_10356 [Halorubrum lipolyticum DSM 21995]
MITESPRAADVPLVQGRTVADVYVDEADAAVAGVAASDLRDDIERVTGERPALRHSLEDCSDTAVVVGTVGRSAGVDACAAAGDSAADRLRGQRESYRIETLRDPTPELDRCVLVTGSDRRGTAYGAYELSKRVGVSPWYWWADVAPTERETVAVEAGSYADGPPSVTYRGIFLNDEDWGLRPWASETFAPEDAEDRPGIGPKTYERVFELLLRLKANTIWPAMHPGTKAFYRYADHAELADRYAVVVGTSHCEPMHRNNVDEWDAPAEAWNYETNRERIVEYWRSRVESVADYENVFTVGMRGIHDSGMPGGETRGETIDLLQRAIDDQRRLLGEAHDVPVDDVPQVFCPYKEVLDRYREGVDVPDDVCLMWPDDSHGYVRELPTEAERERPGGSGVYYHLSYWGRPHDYLWLSSVPPALVKHEMTRAYDAGARECWVVNVGDIKPTEKEMEYFLDLAWDVERVRDTSTDSWLTAWADREFDGGHASEIAAILREYYRLARSRKPEHMGWSTVYPDTPPDEPAYSVVDDGDEARRRVESFDRLVERAEAVADDLDPNHWPSFYELVLYPVRCAAAMSEKHLHAARSRRYAGQGRVSANRYADRAVAAHERIAAEARYYNEDLRDGKWDGMASRNPRELPVFASPSTASVTPYDGSALGVVPEGHERPVRGDESVPPTLPTVHERVDRDRFIDLFSRGTDPVEWTAETSDDWITVSESGGTVGDERRVWIGVDWAVAPAGRVTGTVTIAAEGARKPVRVEGVAPAVDPGADFAVVDGAAAVEAEHFSRAAPGADGDGWAESDVPGRVSGATMAVDLPPDAPTDRSVADAPRLDYEVDVPSTRTVAVEVHCVPTQALNEGRDLRYAVGVGDAGPAIVSIDPDGGEHDPEWQRNVLRGAAIGTTTHRIERTGRQTLRLWGLDPGLVVDRIVLVADGERSTYLGPRETAVGD